MQKLRQKTGTILATLAVSLSGCVSRYTPSARHPDAAPAALPDYLLAEDCHFPGEGLGIFLDSGRPIFEPEILPAGRDRRDEAERINQRRAEAVARYYGSGAMIFRPNEGR